MIAETIILWIISHLRCLRTWPPLRGRCVLRTAQAISMPNVITGTDRLIHRKIKARFRKVNLFCKANVYLGNRRCKQSYAPLTTERLRSRAQRGTQREVEISMWTEWWFQHQSSVGRES